MNDFFLRNWIVLEPIRWAKPKIITQNNGKNYIIFNEGKLI